MRRITLDDVARLPRPGTAIPGALAFSPDGSLLTFLHSQEGTLSRVLWAYDVASGERRVLFSPATGETDENVSHEEAMRRERQRLMHTGVTHYAWAEDANVILVPVLGELWIVKPDGDARAVGENAFDPRLSPDGRMAGFVRDGELWALDVTSRTERRLTHEAEPGVTNGLAEFIAQEELARPAGYWWSRDGAWLAYEQVDERDIPEFMIPHWGADRPGVERHRYPFAGEANARWRLGVVSSSGGETTWLETSGEYLARAMWHPDGRLFVQTLTRDQQRLEMYAYAPPSWSPTLVLAEESPIWINLHDDLRSVPATSEFVWASERTGLKQLELRAPDGSLVRPLTAHPFPVDAVAGFDAEGRRLAYTAAVTPVESQLFGVDLDDGDPEQLTKDSGFNSGVFGKDLSSWIHVHHSLTEPPSLTLRGRHERVVHAPEPVDIALVTPELFTFRARDGETLHGQLYRPARVPAPLIVRVYGGPHAQMVGDSWMSTIDLSAQYLAQEGFAVLSVDNRGSSGRGLAFEGALHRRMGTIEIDDQVDGVAHARAQGWVDGDRVGITGWSYGGYMTIMCMLKAPDVFRAGVAGAPCTSWDGYDTAYTERYMGTPADNPDGYREASALAHAESLRGKLLVIHGMLDENVHFRHTARFSEALEKANRSCDLLLYPSERHGPRSEVDRRTMYERIAAYFKEHL